MSKYTNLSVDDFFALVKETSAEWIDLRFTDPKGKWQHLTMAADVVDEDMLTEGFMFDGSSIAGWKAINESDMILKADLNAVTIDPFTADVTLIVFCDILDPATGQPYERDPRSTAKKAEEYVKFSGVGDTAYFGPEPEFFVFDDVKFASGYRGAMFEIDDVEGPYNTAKAFEGGNYGHRPGVKGGYFPVAPVDSCVDLRGEMVKTAKEMGLKMDKHHHEVAASQHELGMMFSTLTQTADNVQIYKFAVHQVAHT